MTADRSKQFAIVFEHEKATKNTHKYAECPEPGQPPCIGALYVQKWALGSGSPPQRLTVTVEVGSNETDHEQEAT